MFSGTFKLVDVMESSNSNLRSSPQGISTGMLRRPPTNLNKQSEEATVTLIREVLDQGIELSEVCPHFSLYYLYLILYCILIQVYVDALGNTSTYERYLSGLFPGIQFTVTAKADSKFKIVGAASIAAKVTRDAWITSWTYEENDANPTYTWPEERGSGYPSGTEQTGSLFTPLADVVEIQTQRHKRG